MDIPILFEDRELLVVNKPPGVVVNRAQSVKGETVADWVDKTQTLESPSDNSQEAADFLARSGIVHRIDKETSGCLLIAKTLSSFLALQAQFKQRTIKKTYLAIVHGVLVPKEGEIRAPVGRLPWNRERFGIVPGGKEAVTKYDVLETRKATDAGKAISHVQLYPETGRTHQIRVHLKYINHPIVGDYLYAGRKTSRNDRAGAFGRVMLHAQKIVFTHPTEGHAVTVEASIPEDMKISFT
jgi:23S rRNA pseudouridine1911/1915/1917 synthase